MEEMVERVGLSLKKELDDAAQRWRPSTGRATIFRVPDTIRKFDAEAYEPKLISIGPYHRENPTLKTTYEVKLQYTRMVLSRNPDIVLEEYIKKIKAVELEARSFYSEDTNNIGTDEFVMMMLVDGCFVVGLLLMFADDDKSKKNEKNYREIEEYMYKLGWENMVVDMIMLENQIPFLVIEKIFNLAGGSSRGETLVGLALDLLKLLTLNLSERVHWLDLKEPVTGVHHLLQLFHSCLKPAAGPAQPQGMLGRRLRPRSRRGPASENCKMSCLRWGRCWTRTPPTPTDDEHPLMPTEHRLMPMELVPSATELDLAGVKFWSKGCAFESFLDIWFNGRTLEIPRLRINDNTVMILRNLVAFEQCCPNIAAGYYVSVYSGFMDGIIDTPEDVALLHQKKVIVNGLGSNKDVAVQFNNLCKGIWFGPNCYLEDVVQGLSRHCMSKSNLWWAKLKRDYFSNPWSVLSLLGALVLLGLTVIQTGYAIQGYYHQKS